MEGINPQEKLQRAYWEALRTNWAIWPAFQAVNLYMVPVQHQVLAVNVFNIGMLGDPSLALVTSSSSSRSYSLIWYGSLELLFELFE